MSYTRHTMLKRDGSLRVLDEPDPELKLEQRRILHEILRDLPVHAAVHGFVEGRSIHTNAVVHVDAEVLVRVDLRDFFPSVTTARVAGLFRRAGCPDDEAARLALVCTLDGRLPQGAPTSPALANAACHRLDRRLAGFAAHIGWRYTRYADDLTFSAPRGAVGPAAYPVGALVAAVTRFARDEGFQVNERKTELAGPGEQLRVTGLIVNGPGGPRVSRKATRSLRSALHHAQAGSLTEREADRLRGLVTHVAHTNPALGERLRHRLDEVTRSP